MNDFRGFSGICFAQLYLVDFHINRFLQLTIFLIIGPLASMSFLSFAWAQESHEDWLTRGKCLMDVSKESFSAAKFLSQTDRGLDSFAAMDPECRKYILAGLVRQDFYRQDRDNAPPEDLIPDRNLILSKYVGDANWDFQRQVYEEALVSLTTAASEVDFDNGLASELFQTLLRNEPDRASHLMCRMMWTMATFDQEVGTGDIQPERLGREIAFVNRLQPLISQKPALAATACSFQDHKTGQVHQYTIGGLMDLASREAQKDSAKWATPKEVTSTELIQLYSSCSESQLVSIFHNNLQILNPGRDPSQLYVIETRGACSVQGILKRISSNHPSYLFYPSTQLRFHDSQIKPIAFSNVYEVARALKANPRTYILNRTQTVVKPAPVPAPVADTAAKKEKIPADAYTLKGAYEAVQQFFRSGAEAVTGKRR